MTFRHITILLFFIIVAQTAGLIGTLFTADALSGWYQTLTLPALNPPSWVFGPVWSTLYVFMGIAAFIVWKEASTGRMRRNALTLFGIQLFLNALWSIFFFGLQSPLLALIDIILLWVVIIATLRVFCAISRTAAYLLVPYILWVSLALYLNASIFLLN